MRGSYHLSHRDGPRVWRKVFTLQTLPVWKPDDCADSAGEAYDFSLHAGVSAGADEPDQLERLCGYIPYRNVGCLGAKRQLRLQPPGSIGKVPVVDTGRRCSLPVEDTVPRKLAP